MSHAPGARRAAQTRDGSAGLGGSHNRTMTVGPGIAPALLVPVGQLDEAWPPGARGLVPLSREGITAGGELHPALRT